MLAQYSFLYITITGISDSITAVVTPEDFNEALA